MDLGGYALPTLYVVQGEAGLESLTGLFWTSMPRERALSVPTLSDLISDVCAEVHKLLPAKSCQTKIIQLNQQAAWAKSRLVTLDRNGQAGLN